MNILITGHKGLIGSRLYEEFSNDNDVYGWDKHSNGHKDRDELPQELDLIIHCGANTFIRDCINNPNMAKENIDLTYEVYNLARKKNAKVVNFSSSRAYEQNIAQGNINPYVVSKRFSEDLAYAYSQCYEVETLNVRPETIWGYTDDDRVIMKWIRNAIEGKPLEIYGDMDKELSPLHVDYFVELMVPTIIDFVEYNKNNYRSIFVTGQVRKAQSVAEDIIDVANSDSTIKFTEAELTQPQKCPNVNKDSRIETDFRSKIIKVIKKINNE